MKTKLLKKLRKEADKYFKVVSIKLDPGTTRNVGIVVFGEQQNTPVWVSCRAVNAKPYREEEVVAEIERILYAKKREYILRKVASIKLYISRKSEEKMCNSILHRLNNNKLKF